MIRKLVSAIDADGRSDSVLSVVTAQPQGHAAQADILRGSEQDCAAPGITGGKRQAEGASKPQGISEDR